MIRMAARLLPTACAAMVLIAGLPDRQAYALPTFCTGTLLNFPSGDATALPLGDFEGGNCVQAQDKIFGGLSVTNLPSGANINLGLVTVSGIDSHSVAVNAVYLPTATYRFSYDVYDTAGHFITSLQSDFAQSVGTSTLTKTTLPAGTPALGINQTKIGPVTQPGSVTTITYPGVQQLAITDTLTDGGAVSSIEDTIVQTLPVPEPASLGLLGLGMIGLGMLRRRGGRR